MLGIVVTDKGSVFCCNVYYANDSAEAWEQHQINDENHEKISSFF
jgi:hypothetical protein